MERDQLEKFGAEIGLDYNALIRNSGTKWMEEQMDIWFDSDSGESVYAEADYFDSLVRNSFDFHRALTTAWGFSQTSDRQTDHTYSRDQEQMDENLWPGKYSAPQTPAGIHSSLESPVMDQHDLYPSDLPKSNRFPETNKPGNSHGSMKLSGQEKSYTSPSANPLPGLNVPIYSNEEFPGSDQNKVYQEQGSPFSSENILHGNAERPNPPFSDSNIGEGKISRNAGFLDLQAKNEKHGSIRSEETGDLENRDLSRDSSHSGIHQMDSLQDDRKESGLVNPPYNQIKSFKALADRITQDGFQVVENQTDQTSFSETEQPAVIKTKPLSGIHAFNEKLISTSGETGEIDPENEHALQMPPFREEEPDIEDLIEAINQYLYKEYQRFYGP